MKKVKNRAASALLVAFAVIVGMVVFLIRLADDGAAWAMFRANPSVYDGGILNTGTLTDRNGLLLAQAGDGIYRYADDAAVRTACLHAVGDYGGNIGTGAVNALADRLAGYSFVNGVYSGNGQGATVSLTIDAALQTTAYQTLAGRKGAVLVANYETSEILCMVSAPSYDPNGSINPEAPGMDGVYLNRCLSSSFAPGSIFKLVTSAAALENIPDLMTRSFLCQGQVQVNGETVVCTGWHGEQSFEQALANSCNCAFAQITLELGAKKIAQYAEKFGLTQGHSLNGIGTAAGRFDQAEAGTFDLAWSGMGQYNDLVNPYAFLRYVCAIAEGGSLRELSLVEGERGGKTTLLDADTAEQLGNLMRYTAQTAYGADWRFPGLEICAKTGTAEVGDGSSHAWFAGFLRNSAHPLAFVVLVENGGGGLDVAGALANTVLQAAVNR